MWPDDPLEVFVGSGGYEMLATVRQAVTEAATEWSVADLDDLLLVVSELVTNGLDHTRSTVSVRCVRSPAGDIRIEVGDDDPAQPQVASPTFDDDHGRGLLIVAELSEDWGVRSDAPGKTVWAVMSPAR